LSLLPTALVFLGPAKAQGIL